MGYFKGARNLFAVLVLAAFSTAFGGALKHRHIIVYRDGGIQISAGAFGIAEISPKKQHDVLKITRYDLFILVKLRSQPSTGYRWYLQSYNNELLTFSRKGYQQIHSMILGIGGYEYYSLLVLPKMFEHPGKSTKLVFESARPWMKNRKGHSVSIRQISVIYEPHKK